MKSIFKRAAAGVLALAMCAGLTGCYSEDKTWAAKMGDTTLPIGGYIYYLTSAYSEGAGKVDSGAEVLKSDIEGKSAVQWVEDRAVDYLRSYYYVNQKFDELGLELTEEDQSSIQSAATSMWSYAHEPFETVGIAESSFKEAYAVYNMKLSKLLRAMYGKGGELEIPEDELHDYYTGEYIYYQYLLVNLTEVDDEGNTVDMDDDKKAEVKEYLEDQADLISSGRLKLDTAAANYGNMSGAEPNLGDPVAVRADNLSSAFSEALDGLDNDKATVVETTTSYYLVQRLDIEDDFDALIADEDRTASLLSEMRGTDFLEYVIEQGKSLDVQINDKALRSVSPSKVAEVMGKDGTSSASSEESGAESSASSEESSEESGGESSEESSEA